MIGYDQVDDKWSLSKGLYEKCRRDKKLNNTPIVKKRQAGASEKSFCHLPLRYSAPQDHPGDNLTYHVAIDSVCKFNEP